MTSRKVRFLVRVEVDVDEVPLLLGGLDANLLVDQASQQRTVGAAEEGHGSTSGPEQKGRTNVAVIEKMCSNVLYR